MATILDYYTYAKLATAAYVKLEEIAGATFEEKADLQKRLPLALANQMFLLDPQTNPNPWLIPPGGYLANDGTGYAATLFQRGTEKVLAIRGTEPGEFPYVDLEADLGEIGLIGMALAQTISMVNHIQRLSAEGGTDVEQLAVHTAFVTPGVPHVVAPATATSPAVYIYFTTSTVVGGGLGLIGAGETITVTGHSLGGHLAALAARLFPNLVEEAYIYNAPGFDPTAANHLPGISDVIALSLAAQMGAEAAVIDTAKQLTSEIISLFNEYISPVATSFGSVTINSLESEDLEPGDDIDLISGVLTGEQQASQEVTVAAEANSHLIEPFMDALAVHALLYRLNNTLELSDTKSLLEAASVDIADSQERLVEALHKLFTTQSVDLPTVDARSFWKIGAGDISGRRRYYQQVVEIEKGITESATTLQLRSLIGQPVSVLETLAIGSGAENLAYRYALRELNPFVVLGAGYNQHNAIGQLDIYDPTTRAGVLTEEYLRDRAQFLASNINASQLDSVANGKAWTGYGYDGIRKHFEDRSGATPYHLYLGADSSVVGQSLDGMTNILFGGGSHDGLIGGQRWDKLYGGDGNDFLDGRGEDDYLEGGHGEDIYYYASGDGSDQILDIDGQGRILYRDAQGNQSLLTGGRQLNEGGNLYQSTTNSAIQYQRETNGNLTILINGVPAFTVLGYNANDIGIVLEDLSGQALLTRSPAREQQAWQVVINGDQITTDPHDDLVADPVTTHINAGTGNDIASGRSGENNYVADIEIHGGEGDDALYSETFYISRYYELGEEEFETQYGVFRAGEGAHLYGEAGLDVLNGGLLDDTIDGGGEADTAYGYVDHDVMIGGLGNDWMDGNEGRDDMDGGDGLDRLNGGAGSDIIQGSTGDDLIYGDTDTSNLLAWNGTDITVPSGVGAPIGRFAVLTDVAVSEAGDDLLEGGSGDDQIFAGAGDDLVFGDSGDDRIQGEGGDDVIYGGDSADRIFGDWSVDIAGYDAADYLVSGNYTYYWRERHVGLEGNDYVDGEGGNDNIWGGAGNDYLLGGDGNDNLVGGLGDDSASSHDELHGGAGNDVLYGEDGNDVLVGGIGIDAIDGGIGDDVFVFNSGDDVDTIIDQNGNDVLRLGVSMEQVSLSASAGDLVVSLGADAVILRNWIASPAARIESIEFNDGTWDTAEIMRRSGVYVFESNGFSTSDSQVSVNYSISDAPMFASHAASTTNNFRPIFSGMMLNEYGVSATMDWFDQSSRQWVSGTSVMLNVLYGAEGTLGSHWFSTPDANIVTRAWAITHTGTYVQTMASVPFYFRIDDGEYSYGGVNRVIYTGTNDNDRLTAIQLGSPQYTSYYYDGAGHDTMIGTGGRDVFVGGAGNDYMQGGVGFNNFWVSNSDTYYINPTDSDAVFDNGFRDFASGGDIIHVSDRQLADLVFAREGDDLLIGSTRVQRFFERDMGSTSAATEYPYMVEYLEGDGWNINLPQHLVTLGLFNAAVTGSEGNDSITGDSFDNRIYGLTGNDALLGAGGSDVIDGGSGDDTLDGGVGDDRLDGGEGDDVLRGTAGSDRLYGGEGRDILDGGVGNDVLDSGPTEGSFGESLVGGGGADILQGGDGNDTLEGDDVTSEGNAINNYYNNHIFYSGNDTLDGGLGDDYLDGWSGGDIYRIYRGGGRDTINDSGANIFQHRITAIESEIAALESYTSETYTSATWAQYFFSEPNGEPLPAWYTDGFIAAVSTLAAGTTVAGARDALDAIRRVMIESQYDTVEFGAGITPENITVQWSAGGVPYVDQWGDNQLTPTVLWVDVGNGEGVLVDSANIEQFRFEDGRVLTLSQMAALDTDGVGIAVLPGTAEADVLQGASWTEGNNLFGYDGNDILLGSRSSDAIYGGAGDDIVVSRSNIGTEYTDWFEGGSGSDVYLLNAGEINGYVNDAPDAANIDVDTLSFGNGVRPEDLDAVLGFEDFGGGEGSLWLALRVRTTGEEITVGWVESYDDGTGNIVSEVRRVERIQFIDGADNRVYDLAGLVVARDAELRAGYDPASGDHTYMPLFRPQDLATFDVTGQVSIAGGTFAIEYATGAPTIDAPAIFGTAQADALRGSDEAEILYGYAGDDLLIGEGGEDVLQGDTGADVLAGGAGDDRYIFRVGDGMDTIIDSATPGAENEIAFGAGITADSLSLTLGSLLIRVGNNGDAIHLEGFDPANAYGAHAVDHFRFADGTVLTYAQLLQRGFDIAGTESGELISGTNTVDRITALGGDDTVAAGQGNDALAGGGGNDTYFFNLGDGVDTIEDTASVSTANRIRFGAGITADDLAFSQTGDVLTITVGSGGDAIRLVGFDSSGAAGSLVVGELEFADGTVTPLIDLLGPQNNSPVVSVPLVDQTASANAFYAFTVPTDSFTDPDAGDMLAFTAMLANGNALPTWLTFDAATRTFSSIPVDGDIGTLSVRVTATDTAGASVSDDFTLNVAALPRITGTSNGEFLQGSGNAEQIEGLAGNDRLDAYEGNDVLMGGDGNDILNGHAGADTMYGGAGDDTYSVENVADVVIESAGEGNEDHVNSAVTYTLSGNVERLTLAGSQAINGTGNALNNHLIGNDANNVLEGQAGNDRLDAHGGDDTLYAGDGNDILNGHAGADTMYGATGNDVYSVENVLDVVVELAGEGDDHINSSVSYTVTEHVERLTLTGNQAINGTGNSLSNHLSGNNAANVLEGIGGNDRLDGYGGNDTLNGGEGNDILIGAAGNDTYVFNSGFGSDAIDDNDATAGNQDRIEFGIDALNIVFNRSGDDLQMRLHGSSDTLTVNGWYLNSTRHTEVLTTSDGQQLLDTQVDQLIQAMASFSANNGGITWDQAIDTRPQDVQAVITAYWQAAA